MDPRLIKGMTDQEGQVCTARPESTSVRATWYYSFVVLAARSVRRDMTELVAGYSER